ncbi:energy transducer TonB [Stenotrophomonas sp. 364]|uniref:energy transducer TonB n=1 Tax=Stenotrophomonas sp. 364 TaxID=2691571 RepID=UPI0013162700|nr:energy transducer TonB [Stenotrophomonas sp. 364]QHB71806.1 TonB family protein [Stenotrophomonas sp. 364]
MSVTHAHDMHASPQHQRDVTDEPARRGTSPWLWMALIVAMFAAALVWLRYANPSETSTAPVGERMLPATETPVATTAPAPATRQAAPATTQRKPAAAARNREARPLASNAKPTYPPSALRSGVQGSVVASLSVDPSGHVTDASIVQRTGSRDRDLDRAVLTTVRNWQFEPAMNNGRAVASVVRVPVDFRTER